MSLLTFCAASRPIAVHFRQGFLHRLVVWGKRQQKSGNDTVGRELSLTQWPATALGDTQDDAFGNVALVRSDPS